MERLTRISNLCRPSSPALVLALLVSLMGCEIEEVAIPRTQARVAMHGVLSATAPIQIVLLERTRNGSVSLSAPPFELEDPFGSDQGIAEPYATATLTTPDGRTLLGFEDTSPGGSGAGIYRFALPGELLERNATYHLSVTTTQGEVLTAETSVPGGGAATFAEQSDFDRARDTIAVEWEPAPGARSYLVRIETPYGPRSFFTEATQVRLTGALRNVDVTSLPHVFIPGFPQVITVSAVDSNFYDWFRTHNGELTGSGLVNRVQGGLGVFGSLVRLRFQNLRVTAPQTERVAGTFRFAGSPEEQVSAPYLSLELYVESRAARSDQADALSGRYERQMRLGSTGCPVCGLLGSTRNGRVDLVFLRDWFASDTAETFTGEIRGDTIIGRYRGFAGIARFVKER